MRVKMVAQNIIKKHAQNMIRFLSVYLQNSNCSLYGRLDEHILGILAVIFVLDPEG
jgi:hypothetical protein